MVLVWVQPPRLFRLVLGVDSGVGLEVGSGVDSGVDSGVAETVAVEERLAFLL